MKKLVIILITVVVFILGVNDSFAATSKFGVPILMYHSVGNVPGNSAVVSTQNFRKQMQFLKKAGFHTITLDQLYLYLNNPNYHLPAKPVVLTFDDGYRDTYTTVLPILSSLKFKASLFLITNKIAKNIFTKKEIQNLHKGGIAAYPHTHNHLDLKKLSKSQQNQEISLSEKIITNLNGKKPYYFCYPYSHYNQTTINLLKQHGYRLAFGNQSGWVKRGDNPFTLKRVYIGNSVTLSSFKERLTTPNYRLVN